MTMWRQATKRAILVLTRMLFLLLGQLSILLWSPHTLAGDKDCVLPTQDGGVLDDGTQDYQWRTNHCEGLYDKSASSQSVVQLSIVSFMYLNEAGNTFPENPPAPSIVSLTWQTVNPGIEAVLIGRPLSSYPLYQMDVHTRQGGFTWEYNLLHYASGLSLKQLGFTCTERSFSQDEEEIYDPVRIGDHPKAPMRPEYRITLQSNDVILRNSHVELIRKGPPSITAAQIIPIPDELEQGPHSTFTLNLTTKLLEHAEPGLYTLKFTTQRNERDSAFLPPFNFTIHIPDTPGGVLNAHDEKQDHSAHETDSRLEKTRRPRKGPRN